MRKESERGGSEARKEQRGSPSEKEKERKERGKARQGCVCEKVPMFFSSWFLSV